MSDIPREFVFTRYPARQGHAWLRTAYNMFSRHRGPWVVLVLGYFSRCCSFASSRMWDPWP